MPWGSWVTCEETVNGPDVGARLHRCRQHAPPEAPRLHLRGARRRAVEPDCRSCTPAGSPTRQRPSAPDEGNLYLTEDNFAFPSGFYRYIPPENPMAAGRARGRRPAADAQGRRGRPGPPRRRTRRNGASYPVEWVDIDEPVPGGPTVWFPSPDRRTTRRSCSSATRAAAQGAARFSRLEGATFAQGRGLLHVDPGWRRGRDRARADRRLRERDRAGVVVQTRGSQTLTCRYQSPDATALELPDNITHRNDRGTHRHLRGRTGRQLRPPPRSPTAS